MTDNDNSTTVELRDEKPDEQESMAKLAEADGDVYGYLSRGVSDELGEFMSLTISDDADVTASLDSVTGKGSGNYAVYETPGGAVVGLGIALSLLESTHGFEVERDEDGIVQNAPESVGLAFSASDEDAWESAQEADEDEVEGLIAGGSDDESDDEEEVEISDEELDLVADD